MLGGGALPIPIGPVFVDIAAEMSAQPGLEIVEPVAGVAVRVAMLIHVEKAGGGFILRQALDCSKEAENVFRGIRHEGRQRTEQRLLFSSRGDITELLRRWQ